MRIGIDLTALLPQRTGVDNYILGLVSHLAQVDERNRYRLFVNREDRALFGDSLPHNFKVIPLSLRPRPVRLFFQQALLPPASLSLDILHSPAFLMPVAKGRTPQLLTVFDMTFFSMPEHHIALRRSALYQRAVLAAIRRSDRVTVPTRAVKGDILDWVPELPPERIEVIGHGVGDAFRPHTPDEIRPVLERLGLPDDYLLYVGTIEPRKNLETLLEAFSKQPRPGKGGPHLIIAGKLGWDYERLLARLEQPDLQGRVHLPGYVAEADLPMLFAGARLFVYPSWGEGFGFPPLEAMASGVPVIASRTPAVAENLDGAAELIEPGDVSALSAAIGTLLRDGPGRRRLTGAGIERAAEFRWERSAQRTLELYEELAAEGPRT